MNIKDFLAELTVLSNKYGIKIEGCGCCGSPALTPIKPETINNYYEVDDKNENLIWTKNQTSN
jgi:hypothetical protein